MESKPLADLKELLINYLERKGTDDEKFRLYNLLMMPENELSVKDILLHHLQDFDETAIESKIDFDRIYQCIITEIEDHEEIENQKLKIERKSKIIRLFKISAKVAAIFIPAFVIGVIYMYLTGSGVLLNKGSQSFCEIKAPLGAKSEIILPDGSHVMLNAGSKIKYYTDFNIHDRNIQLEGEAYFKVAKNKNIPLIVSVANIHIRAVGTEFNVKAYKNERQIETTLIEGVVEISKVGTKADRNEKISLTPNQKAVYVKEADQLSVSETNTKEKVKTNAKAPEVIYIKPYILANIDVTPIVSWTNDQLIFRGETLDNICIKLNRKYNVTFEFENEDVKKLRFTGTLEDETIEQVLNVIKSISPIEFTMNKKAVNIRENTKQAHQYLKFMKNR